MGFKLPAKRQRKTDTNKRLVLPTGTGSQGRNNSSSSWTNEANKEQNGNGLETEHTILHASDCNVVAVDPGSKRCGIAFMGQPPYVEKDITVQKIHRLLMDLEPFSTVIIESNYIGNYGNRIFPLLKIRFGWEILAETRYHKVVLVSPSTWQSWTGAVSKKDSKKDRKEKLRALASKMYGQEIEADACDAYLMLKWYEATGGTNG